MNIFKHEIGAKAKDLLTGFEGIITARCQHLTGCNTYALNPQKLDKGRVVDCLWFDENRIKVSRIRT